MFAKNLVISENWSISWACLNLFHFVHFDLVSAERLHTLRILHIAQCPNVSRASQRSSWDYSKCYDRQKGKQRHSWKTKDKSTFKLFHLKIYEMLCCVMFLFVTECYVMLCWWNFHYLCCQLINEKADARFIFFWYSSGKHIGRLRGAIIWWDYSYLYSYFVYIFLGVNFGLFLFTEYIGVCSMIGCEQLFGSAWEMFAL